MWGEKPFLKKAGRKSHKSEKELPAFTRKYARLIEYQQALLKSHLPTLRKFVADF